VTAESRGLRGNPPEAGGTEGRAAVAANRKAFLLRVDPALLDALQKWADDELRSLNGQIEYVLRRALKDRGRLKDKEDAPGTDGASEGTPGTEGR
jgi:hypothetical protein